jgi:hypothetical protein
MNEIDYIDTNGMENYALPCYVELSGSLELTISPYKIFLFLKKNIIDNN